MLTPGNLYDKELPLERHRGSVEGKHTLSYLEGDLLALIPHVSGRFSNSILYYRLFNLF
jgi:hypothetical protein